MKLYCIPGACSRAANILLRKNGVEFEMVLVNPANKKTHTGGDYLTVNPLGYVPALEMDDGSTLIENTAILQWIADTYGPAPENALARAKMTEELSFISAELHKAFSPFFSATPPEGEAREAAIAKVHKMVGYYETTYLTNERDVDPASAYAYAVLSWADFLQLDISQFTAARQFIDTFRQREVVKAASDAEMAFAQA